MKASLLRFLKWMGIIFLIVTFAIAIGLPVVNSISLSRTRTEAQACGRLEHIKITDERLDGTLDFECDKRNGLSWLYYSSGGGDKLVWQDSQAYAKVSVTVCGRNKISIFYDFDPGDTRKDSTIYLDLGKGETFHTNYWKSIFETVGR